ncbi:MAG: ABC transporter permease [Nitrososphaerota archaeon]|nr:ABC transporter permease [Nitrososphaerota archaeon]
MELDISTFGKLWALVLRELRNWIRSPILAVTFFVGPLIWIFVFGNAFNAAFFASGSGVSSLQGAPDYFNFLATAMFVVLPMAFANRTGASIFADRFKGYLDRLLVSPTSRETIVFSKICGGIILGFTQVVILMILTVPVGLELSNITIARIALLLASILLVSYGYSSIFLMISMRIKRWPTQQLIGSMLVTPIMFLSNAFYPESRIPILIRWLVSLNPVSYGIVLSRDAFFEVSIPIQTIELNLGALVLFAALISIVLVFTSRKLL